MFKLPILDFIFNVATSNLNKMIIYNSTQNFYQKIVGSLSPKLNVFKISSCSIYLNWDLNHELPTHYLLGHDDFMPRYICSKLSNFGAWRQAFTTVLQILWVFSVLKAQMVEKLWSRKPYLMFFLQYFICT